MTQTQTTIDGENELDFKIREARTIIANTVQRCNSNPLIINFSGGKDSQTLLDLVSGVTDNFLCFYMISGIDFQESIDFAKASCEKLGYKMLTSCPSDYKGGFFERLPIIGYFPTVQNTTLWCNRDLKIRPQYRVLQRHFGKNVTFYKLNGVRRYESARRMKIHASTKDFMRMDYHVAKSVMVFPILNWTDEDVRAYLKAKSITVPKNPLYEKYGVSGCWYCPFYQPSIYRRIMRLNPCLYDEIIEWETRLNKPAGSGFTYLRDLKKEILNGHS